MKLLPDDNGGFIERTSVGGLVNTPCSPDHGDLCLHLRKKMMAVSDLLDLHNSHDVVEEEPVKRSVLLKPDVNIHNAGIPLRTQNCLLRMGVKTLNQLYSISHSSFSTRYGVTGKILAECVDALERFNLLNWSKLP